VELLRLAEPEHAAAAKYSQYAKDLRKRGAAAYKAEVAKTRMPEDNYKQADRKKLQAIAKKAASADGKVMRVTIGATDWTEPRTLAWWNEDGKLEWGTWRWVKEGAAAV